MHNQFSLQNIDIVTTLSTSAKSEVSLVSLKNTPDKLAILKKYHGTSMPELYQRIADLKSEYFPEIYAVWEENGDTLLLEEYISGETLQDKLNTKELLQEKEVTYYMLELCKTLHVLHNAVPPIIHRDLKPENVIVTKDSKIKLLDFDASREFGKEKERDTVLLGTKEYASPEQFGFMQTDIRSDIYSWGIVYSELLGQAQARKKYIRKAKKIINRATMFDPEKRYPDTDALIKDIRQLEQPNCLYKIVTFCTFGLAVTGAVCIIISNNSPQDAAMTHDNSVTSTTETQAEISAEIPSSLLEIEPPEIEPVEALPLAEVYNYVSIAEEVQPKYMSMQETHSYLYSGLGYDDNDSGIYSPTQETIIGTDYVALRFLQAYPRDIVIQDNRFESLTINTVSYCRYLEDRGIHDSLLFLEADDFSSEFGNIVSISADFLQTLEPGAYTFTINAGSNMRGLSYGFYLIVHSYDEQVDNFRVHALNEIAYYSSEKKNDVVFYINNTPYPIQEVSVNNAALSEDAYDLVDEGFGIVLYPEFLAQYEEQEAVELLIQTANGKRVGCRVIYLKHF